MELFRKFYMADPPGRSAGPSKEDISNAEALADQYARMKTDIVDVSAIFNTMAKALRGNSAYVRSQRETTKSIESDLKKAAKSIDATREKQQGLTKQYQSSKKAQEEINKIKSIQASIESSVLQLERQGITLDDDKAAAIERALAAMNEQLEIEDSLLEKSKLREKSIGNLGKLFQGLTKIPIVGQLIDAQSVQEKINKTAEKTGSRYKAFGAGVVEVFKSIGRSLTDPTTILLGFFGLLKSVYDLAVKFDQKTFDIAKNLGVTVNEATTLQKQFVDIANSSKNFGLTSSQLAKTYGEISNSLGFLAPANKEFLETATLIQKRLGASAEDMSALALQSTLSGKTLEETMGTLNASRNIEGARNRLLLSQKQILDGIAKTSATVLINFKGNVSALGDAIVRATKLGTTLDTINKQGESLLDFESSISAEFEAQLLTGRDINLTRAREFALAGDTKNLMEELNRQGATYQQFMSENVIARQAEAKAVGLSVEEYSKILLQQQQANRLGAEQGRSALEQYNLLVQRGATQEDIIKKLGSEQEAADLKKASMQDKFQATIERLQETLGQIVAGPMSQLITDITTFLSKSENVKMIADTIKSTFKGIASAITNLPQIMERVVFAAKLLASIAIATAAANVTAASALSGPFAITAGIGTAIALESLLPAGAFLGSGAGGGGSMTEPINPNVAAANSQAAAANAEQKPIVLTFHHTTELEGQPLSKVTKKEFMLTQGQANSTE